MRHGTLQRGARVFLRPLEAADETAYITAVRASRRLHRPWSYLPETAEDFGAMLELLRAGKIHPVVAERLPLAEARRAHELLDSSAAKGKLVLVP